MGLSLRGTTSGAVDINAPAVAGDNTITLPGNNGSANQFYKNSGTAGIVTHSSMVEDSSGNVGIGTDDPSALLHLSGSIPIIKLQDNNNTGVSALQRIDAVPSTGATQWFVGQNSTTTNDLYLYNVSNANLLFGTNNTERLRIDSSGSVGIGTDNPTNYYSNDLVVAGGSEGGITIGGPTTGQSYLAFADGTVGNERYRGYMSYNHASDNLIFASAVSERMRLDSSGRLLVGTDTSPTAGNGQYANIVVQGYPSTPQGAGHISLQRGQAAFGANNQIGLINFGDNTGASYAGIECYADAASGANDFPGRLVFSTTADSAATPTERLRIDSSGRVLIGSTVATGNWNVYNGIQILDNAFFYNYSPTQDLKITSNAYYNTGIWKRADPVGASMLFLTGSASMAAIRLAATGTADSAITWSQPLTVNLTDGICFGRQNGSNVTTGMSFTNPESTAAYCGITNTSNSASARVLLLNRQGSDGTVVEFRQANSTEGSISIAGALTSYNTSSDYRLKENVVDITDGITRIKQLSPRRFNFISHPGRTVDGFIAHEAQSVVPQSVTGTKDAVDDDGTPVHQGIDQSKLVPLLTAAIKELITEVETLKAKVQVLEG